jgi:hypothetical protein
MTLPANNKAIGDIGHVDDHNSIVDEISTIKSEYFPISSSAGLISGLLPISASSNFLFVSSSSNFLPMSSSSNFLFISASSNFLPMSSSSNFLPISASSSFYPLNISINAQTETTYNLVLSDSGKIIEMNNASANIVVIPVNASVAFPVGTKIDIIQTGAGATSASTVAGVTLNSDTAKRTINAQWAAASLIKRSTNTWIIVGALKA